MISPKDIKKISELSRVELSSEEEKKLAADLESVLDYIEKLKEVDVSGLSQSELFSHFNDFRQDIRPKEIFDPKPLFSAAPETQKGFIKVKSVFKNDKN
ncbi:MAG: Asp-tRNA(Asn)/Glu-tRNA(Gln) amidotransferase subunit GatC [Patescibacteria group bacterium]